jgi:predicted XRE-type DNA-binding protein
MKKTIPGWDDTRITPSCGNVFIDLGFDEAEAQIMVMRVELMVGIEKHIAAQGWTQAEAAKRLGITQPRVSKLKKGAWDEFSVDMLLTLAARAGLHPELRLAA